MISIAVLVVSLIVSGILIFKNLNNHTPLPWLKPVIVAVSGIVLSLIQPFAVERIDAGHKGIIVNLSGSERGVAKYQYTTGWVVYNTWFRQVLEFPIYQQHIEYDDQVVITKGGFSATIKPSFNYSLKPEAIGEMLSLIHI